MRSPLRLIARLALPAAATGFACSLAFAAPAAPASSPAPAPSRADDPAMFPFVLPWDDASPGPADFSGLLHAPAGKFGHVHVHEGRLHVGDDGANGPRQRIRFWGVNLSFAANFPTREEAVAVAGRLAKFGVNCVRFHHMDRHAAPRGILSADMRSLDPEQLERLDFFIAELKRRGIYANLNLHVSRYYPDYPDEKAGGTRMHKGVDMFTPGMIEWQKTFARELLHHRNPHTGLTYAEDPAVALVEINNENGVISRWWDGVLDDVAQEFTDEFRSRWNAWIVARHGSPDAAREAWLGPEEPLGDELLQNADFSDHRRHWTSQNADDSAPFVTLAEARKGIVLRQAAASAEPRRTEIYQRGLRLAPGRPYTLRLVASAASAQEIVVGVKDARAPWRIHATLPVTLAAEPTAHEFSFAYEAEADAEVRLNLSGFNPGGGDILVESISLRRGGRAGEPPAAHADGLDIVRKRDFRRLAPLAQRDWMKFLWDTEAAYYADMRDYLRAELGVRSLLVGSQLGAYSIFPVQDQLDVIDIHAYWQHPTFPGRSGDWQNWIVGNKSMVNEPDGGYASWSAMYRVADRPFLITEYNHSSPNTYSAEGFPLMAAYGALQDFDGIFAYSYSHLLLPWDSGRMPGIFDMDQHPVKMATFPISAALFLRGDVSVPAKRSVTPISESGLLDFMRRGGTRVAAEQYGADRLDGLRHPHGVRLDPAGSATARAPEPKTYAGPVVSEGGQLVWNAAPDAGIVTVDTPRTQAAIGFGRGRTHKLDRVAIRPGETMQDWSMIALTQTQGDAIGSPGRALLVAAGYIENTGQVWKNAEKSSLSSWGRAPTLVEGVRAEISLRLDAGRSVEVWSLDERGQRARRVPVDRTRSGVRFSIGPDYKTLWYEVVTR